MGQGNETHLCNSPLPRTPFPWQSIPQCGYKHSKPRILPASHLHGFLLGTDCWHHNARGCHPVLPPWRGVCRSLCAQEASLTSRATSELTGLKWFILKKPFAPPFEFTYAPLSGERSVQASESCFLCWQWSQRGVDEDFLCEWHNPAINRAKIWQRIWHKPSELRLWHREVIQAEITSKIWKKKRQVLLTVIYLIICHWHWDYNQRLCLGPKALVCVSPGPTAHRKIRVTRPETLFFSTANTRLFLTWWKDTIPF